MLSTRTSPVCVSYKNYQQLEIKKRKKTDVKSMSQTMICLLVNLQQLPRMDSCLCNTQNGIALLQTITL